MKNLDVGDVVALAKQLSFEIEMVLAKENYGVDLQEEWNQKGPRVMVRFLVDQVATEDFDVRKTALIQNVERLKSWLNQDEYDYQKRHPRHINEMGGSVPARRVSMHKHCEDFIALCKKDVHEVMELYDLCGLTAEQSQAIVNQPIETIVFDEKNPDHTVLVEANRNEKSNKKKTTDYEQRMMGGGVGLKF